MDEVAAGPPFLVRVQVPCQVPVNCEQVSPAAKVGELEKAAKSTVNNKAMRTTLASLSCFYWE